jgi:dihydrofolate synthase/folylpolyglutamate synthase
VAGTNGKGSTASLIHAGLVGPDRRVGLYTSPHLVELRERIRVDGQPISESDVVRLGWHCIERWSDCQPDGHKLTYFELVTLMAALHFAESGVDVAVVEVGLGGRLDATNAFQRQLSVITPVDLDHTRHLGADVPAILGEKAAIIEVDRPAVACLPDGWTAAGLRRALADRRASPLWVEGGEFGVEAGGASGSGERPAPEVETGQLWVGDFRASGEWLALPGRHQRRNAACALATLALARERGWGFIPPLTELPARLSRARWPGRWTTVEVGGRAVHIDCAHNPHAAAAAAGHVRTHLGGAVTLLLGSSAGKALDPMLEHLLPVSRRVIAVELLHPRIRAAREVAAAVRAAGRPCEIGPGPLASVQLAAEHEEPIVVLGSIFLAGALLERLGYRAEDLPVLGPARER